MLTTAAQMAAYLYPEEEDPEGAFSWWLAPCGGTDLVPDEIKKIFSLLTAVSDGISSFVEPKRLSRGSGRRGDNGNPHESDRSNPNPPTAPGRRTASCKIPKGFDNRLMGAAKNVWQMQECKNGATHITELVISECMHGFPFMTTKPNHPFLL
jgi:hypothetical protein